MTFKIKPNYPLGARLDTHFFLSKIINVSKTIVIKSGTVEFVPGFVLISRDNEQFV